VLVTNDDGIASPGLAALARALGRRCAGVLVARARAEHERRRRSMGPIGPSVRGSTAWSCRDRCAELLRARAAGHDRASPRMSGAFGVIRPRWRRRDAGVNLGRAILHSGTVGAAMTGQNLGLPAVAVSLQGGDAWAVAARAACVRSTRSRVAAADGSRT
jgi:5'-nucleotidase